MHKNQKGRGITLRPFLLSYSSNLAENSCSKLRAEGLFVYLSGGNTPIVDAGGRGTMVDND